VLLLTLNYALDANATMDTHSGADTETALHVHQDQNNENKGPHGSPQDCQQSTCHSVLLAALVAIRIQVANNLKFCSAPVRWVGALCSPPDRPPRTIL